MKHICMTLKAIRKQIADANGIKYEPVECHYEGPCSGTCPKCEAELRYIEQQLDLRRVMGKAVVVAGLSVGLTMMSGCDSQNVRRDNTQTIEKSQALAGEQEIVKDRDTSNMKEYDDRNVIGAVGYVPSDNESCYIEMEQSEDENPDENKIYDVVEKMPEFPGGMGALVAWLRQHTKLPKYARDNKIAGRAILLFVVEKDGSLSDVKVVKSIDPVLDVEAVRIVKSMPKFIPGRHKNRVVRVKYTVPVTFRIEETSNSMKSSQYVIESTDE